MSEATGTFHLSRTRLDGPAERTVVQPWLTELSHAALNAYAETAPAPALALVEALPVQSPMPVPVHVSGRRVALAA
ncbi:hypothetical protein AGRA3207_001879 [Actinomadura graeca]|uniref:Uncharacterized protein n=1 Tax=Actinomadura graeca TaxID=2750812 RepID=A0ABX8QS77_9ACTN|nr:hypothetical protein [Actinomadura graeca]QXJ21064.1 hypothetical protein AGRA3207_001879 [Actinomadura graeca]